MFPVGILLFAAGPLESGNMFKLYPRKSFNSKRADFRKAKHETTEEFLARGGKISKIPKPSLKDVWDKGGKRGLFEK
jgi:hypothetical protein